MYYIIYKITNQINGKFYIGSHKTKDLDDMYMGSGKYLLRAQKKYGIENFKKEILFVFDNAKEMYAKESEIVNEDFLVTENTYNLKVGGFGGWNYVNEKILDTEIRKLNGSLGAKIGGKKFSTKHNPNRGLWYITNGLIDKKISKGSKIPDGWRRGRSNGMKNINHSEKTKQIIGEKNSVHQLGPGNSQFGTIWITDGAESKKIGKTDVIPDGWKKGRIIKK